MKTLRLKRPHPLITDLLKGNFKKPIKFFLLRSIECAISIVSLMISCLIKFKQGPLFRLRGKILNINVSKWSDTMKVVGVSNFNLETVDDILVSEHETPEDARAIAKEMNDSTGMNDKYYYKAVDDSYVLHKFEP